MDSVSGESGAVVAVVWQYDGYGIQHGGSGVVTSGHDALQEKGSVWSPWNEHTGRGEPQRRANSNGSTSHEEWKYHEVYAGAVHIGNYSRCVHRPGGNHACQKASVHRILE